MFQSKSALQSCHHPALYITCCQRCASRRIPSEIHVLLIEWSGSVILASRSYMCLSSGLWWMLQHFPAPNFHINRVLTTFRLLWQLVMMPFVWLALQPYAHISSSVMIRRIAVIIIMIHFFSESEAPSYALTFDLGLAHESFGVKHCPVRAETSSLRRRRLRRWMSATFYPPMLTTHAIVLTGSEDSPKTSWRA